MSLISMFFGIIIRMYCASKKQLKLVLAWAEIHKDELLAYWKIAMNSELPFKNSESRIFDMSPYLNKGIYTELKDIDLFNSVSVCFDSMEWASVS